MTMTKAHWSVAQAKASLAQVLSDATLGPQVIERRGKPVAVVLSLADYQEAIGDPDDGGLTVTRWKRFLRASSELRSRGGATLAVSRRAPRASPFGRTR
jgi:prevent-host-death family protein